MNSVLLFPGQGAQFIGMGKELYDAFSEAKEVFQEVDEALKKNLSKLIFSGEIEELTITYNAQPAIMAVSIAVLKVLEKQGKKSLKDYAQLVAGHSLGEYSALCAAQAFTLKDTANLLNTRGNAMNNAIPKGEGAMVALLGASIEQAEKLCDLVGEFGICEVANDNGVGQIVLSGSLAAIEKSIEMANQCGIKKAIKLNVSSAFHSKLIKSAEPIMEEALSKVNVKNPIVPIINNVTAKESSDINEIKKLLVSQVTGRVRWRESIELMYALGVKEYIEIGPGKVLTSIAKRMFDDIKIYSILTPNDVEEFLNKF
jgi:malonyl CoA-acyl carrier protein transacylase